MDIAGEKSRWISHLLVWIGGVLWALAVFIHTWEIVPHMPLRLGYGQFGFNLLISAFLFLFGGTVSAYWWRLCTWLQYKEPRGSMILSHGWFIFGLFSALGWMSQGFYEVITCLILLGGLVYSFICYKRSNRYLDPYNERLSIAEWFKQANKYNLWFFVFFGLTLWANNVAAAWKLDITSLELVSVILGRFFFSCFLAIGLFFASEVCMRALPKYARWLPWLVFAVMPFLIVSDMIQSQIYGRGVIEVLNNLTSNGSIDVRKELLAGGFGDISVNFLLSAIAGGYLVAGLIAYILWRISNKYFRGITMLFAVLLMAAFYSLSVTEQWVGKYWKSLPSWQQENKLFILNQGLVKPKLGLADFKVVFKEYQFVSSEPSAKAKEELPDIYIFMVESMRHDSMSSKTTPFLMEFQNDCQSFDMTLAASNSTHLSWYGMFYSKPSIFWQRELLTIEDRDAFVGSPILNELYAMGYDMNIRTACDLGYKDIGLLNFGSEGVICEMIEQVVDGNELSEVNIPEREKIIFNRLRDSLTEDTSVGGNLYFTAMDSPHYNYYWDDEFEVPYTEYKDDISFPLFPSKEEVRLYHNRYLNSVAWVDHQLQEFCDFLKKEGRYKNSIIIITGDHGEEFQEQGGWCHCTSLMPEQTRVPLFIKWPADKKDAPAKYAASHADVFPSIFSYLGVSEDTLKTMSGSNLLDKDANETALVATAFANKDGETLFLRNDKYTAYFSWSRPWEPRVPEEMRLERIVDAEGNLLKIKKTDYRAKLEELFPDAFDRYFESLTEIE